ncbi:MAG: hypothetical protein AB1736_12965 [Chloroflexota bacterium]
MNPARSLGPAPVRADFASLSTDVTAPSVGTVLAVLLYGWLRFDRSTGHP